MRPFRLVLLALAVTAILEAITSAVEWTRPVSYGGRVYWRGQRRRAVALTFDDGPTAYTPAVLDLLAERQVRATFFALGERVECFPEIAQRIIADGHEIANHTYSLACQQLPWRFYLPGVGREVWRGQQAILKTTGIQPRFFRTPAGQVGRNLWREVERLDLKVVHGALPIALPRQSATNQLAILRRQIAPGAILILHDGLDSDLESAAPRATLELLPLLIDTITERGYRIVPLGELLGLDVATAPTRPWRLGGGRGTRSGASQQPQQTEGGD
ncbi:MAG: polysaccharide deacetylase family protein [Dehalococcoidia bacterium]